MNIQVIAEHSVDLDLLSRDSVVIDCGCRNFGWAKEMLLFVDKVHCWDADNNIVSPNKDKLPFYWAAIGPYSDVGVPFVKYGNGTGNFVLENEKPPTGSVIDHVPMFSLEAVASAMQVDQFDLIKMDIEGLEYEVLSTLKRPIAKQITFELHEHTEKKRGKDYVNIMLDHLGKWYDIAYIDYSCKHGCGMNWWDVLHHRLGKSI